MQSPPSPVTVAIARFEDLVARGLRALLDEDASVRVVAEGIAPERLSEVLAEHRPEVAFVNFGSLRSPVDVHELHQRHPATRLVILANRPTASESNQMLAFGATACLAKDTQARDILNAVHLASRGLQLMPQGQDGRPRPASPGPELLTPREAEVLDLLRAGHSNAQIALALHVGIETVRTHARNIYRKLGVSTRRELQALPVQSAGLPPAPLPPAS